MKNKSDNAANSEKSKQSNEKKDNFLIVGIGTSAGGIQALKTFFENVPEDSGLAYVVILHLSPEFESRLAEILQTVSKIPVRQINDRRIKVKPNCVYVIAPNKSLTMNDGHLSLKKVRQIEERRAPIDVFFRTLAESHESGAVSVILTGTGANGSSGIRRIKEMGGIVIVQDPKEAEYDDMPRNSLATELVDYVLPVAEIPAKIINYRDNLGKIKIPSEPERRAAKDEKALREIFTHLRVRTGHDFTNYKRASIVRRIERRINVQELGDLSEYAEFLREHPAETQALLKDLLISVTNFFRDKAAFENIEKEIIPKLFQGKKSKDTVRVWVAGCATGEEAYSLAILLMECAANRLDAPAIQIFATDIDEKAIAQAREGFYTDTEAADVSPERLRRFFHKEKDGYRVRRELREIILFAVHNLIKDAPFSHLDLVTCRNLLIYLNRSMQDRVMDIIHFALKPNGFMFLGSSESIERKSDLFIIFDKDNCIFQSRPIMSRLPIPVPDMSPTFRFELPPVGEDPKISQNQALERLSYLDLHQQLLEKYAPPSVIVNAEYDILHLSPTVGKYLQIKGGEPTFNLLKIISPELRIELRTALYEAVRRQTNVEIKDLQIKIKDSTETINLHIRPVLRLGDANHGLILVIFEQVDSKVSAENNEKPLRTSEPVIQQLEDELIHVKSQLRTTVEQFEVQTEEYKVSNEELQSTNEELRAAAEELEMSKEELQSLNEELTTVNQELKIKIEELSQSNNDFQNLMNSTAIGTMFLSRELHINFFTPTMRGIFNLIPADIGRPLADIKNSLADDSHLHADIEFVLENLQIVERELQTRSSDWFLMRILPYRTSEARINGVILTFIDITNRKKSEKKLLESEERYRTLFDTIDEGFCIIEMIFDDANNPIDYRFVELNPMFEKLTGIKNAKGKLMKELVPDIEDFWVETYGNVAVTGEPVRFEHYSETMNRWFDVYASWVADDRSGKVALVFSNITERKQAEHALNESEERLRVAMQAARMGTWDWDLLTNEIIWSPEHNKMYDLPVNQEIGTFEEFITRVHPEDIEPLKAELDAAIKERRTSTAEIRSIHSDGSIHWISGNGRAFYDEKGNAERMIGVVRDITVRKRAEESLRRSEERLRLILESVTDYAIITTDTEGFITGWNAGAEKTFGYTTEEILGTDITVIFTPEDRENNIPEMEMQTAIEKGRAEDKRFHLHKDGSRFYVSGVLSPLRDGKLIGFVKVARDLTKEKEAEEALIQAHEQLEMRIQERTAELAEANEEIQKETKQRLSFEKERVALLKKLVQTQEDERRRIARDLHDHLGQQLTALRLKLESLRSMCEDYEELCAQVDETQAVAKQIDKDVGFLAWELRPTALDDFGLRQALFNYVTRWSDQFGIEAESHIGKFDETRLAGDVEIHLYRILQEALNNTAKHAEAGQVSVILKRRNGNIILIIEDNGKGFNVAKQTKPKKDGKGLGIIGMKERAQLIGGMLEIESTPGSGTAVFVRIPVEMAWKKNNKSETDNNLK